MSKKKITYRRNRVFNSPAYYYSWGGDFKKGFKDSFSGSNIGSGLADCLGGIGQVVGSTIGGDLESGAGSAISNIGGAIGKAIPGPIGGIVSGAAGLVGGLVTRMFGSKLNKEKIAEVEKSNKAVNTVMVDSSSADSVMNQWANQDFGADFSESDIGRDGWFSNKARNKYKELKKQQGIARERALASYENAADAVDTQSDLNTMASFAAFGGPLGIWGGYGSGAIGYELAKESLGIKALNAANKGKLTSLPN